MPKKTNPKLEALANIKKELREIYSSLGHEPSEESLKELISDATDDILPLLIKYRMVEAIAQDKTSEGLPNHDIIKFLLEQQEEETKEE